LRDPRGRYRVHSVPPPVPEPNVASSSSSSSLSSSAHDRDRDRSSGGSRSSSEGMGGMGLAIGGGPGSQQTQTQNNTLCKYWKNQQVCKNGKNCRFLHGETAPSAFIHSEGGDESRASVSPRLSNEELEHMVICSVVRILQGSLDGGKKGVSDAPLVAQVGFLLRRSYAHPSRSTMTKSQAETHEAVRRYLDTPDGRLLHILRRYASFFSPFFKSLLLTCSLSPPAI
jgi:Zinc finger C-x8-C-x5-C-x3-H type (and similar)